MTWISSIASQIMDAVSGLFLNALGTDMVTMEEYFPFITKAFDVMQYTAWAVLFLIVVWQLFRAFGGPITEAENPWQLVVRGAIFALLIGYAKPIFMLALDIARAPYTALMDVSMTAEEFTFAGVEQVLSNGLLTIVSTVTVVGPILVLILLIALGWNYFKLLLEAVERYIVVGVLCYTSPLAFCMGGSKATNQVFKSWCRMVGSQLLLLVMNVWFMQQHAEAPAFEQGEAADTYNQAAFLVIIVLIVSLPSVVTNSVFGLDGSMVDMENPTTLLESYNHLAADISAVVEEGYDAALAKVEQIIEDGGYDYDLSMDALINYAQGSAGYDVSYILAAYSASLQQRNTGKEDMLAKLRSVADSMFPVAFVEKESEQIVPFTYATYRPVTVTVVTSKTQTGTINGVPQYRYTTARRTYYEPDETITTSEPVNVAAYTPVVVSVPIYSGGRITGTRSETYYEQDGNETLTPETEVVKYVECTIQPFDNSVIIRAFGIDPSATYDQFKITYGEAIQKMANALKMTLYGTLGNGQMVPLTDAELIAFVNAQSCSPMRKHILTTALSLVGKVPYFWGGKSAPGWNDAWNTPRLVTSAGSPTTGTIRPFGLDCSGFTTWVFNTAVGVEIGAGCNGQYPNTYGISAAELLPGDLGFLADDDGWGHVLIFAGYDAEGTRMWVHSSGGIGVILNTPSYEGRLSYRRLSIVDYDAPVVNSPNGEALYTLEVEVTHYCACAKCCGSNAQGLTASGKQAAVGMVAMSSHYPFGTQIMINGTMYTVEDRGGSGIENNIHRVDIYVPDHQQALRMGRYTTTATIYRLGR